MGRLALGVAGAVCLVSIVWCSGCPGSCFLPARARVVHASPDAPAVDVCADGLRVFQNVEFGQATAYAQILSGTYAVRVTAAGAGCAAAGVIDAQLTLQGLTDTTVVAIDFLENIEPLVLTDDNSAPAAGNAKVRFVHVSPNAPTVDITLPDGSTLFDDVSFGESGGYIEVAAGSYDLEVRDETGTAVVLTVDNVCLENGFVYTVFAIGLLDGSPALDVLLTVDRQ